MFSRLSRQGLRAAARSSRRNGASSSIGVTRSRSVPIKTLLLGLAGTGAIATYLSIRKIQSFEPSQLPLGPASVLDLPDGRKLCFTTYGPNDAKNVVFLFHEYGGSRLELISQGLDDYQLFSNLNVKIIAVDRPGYGGSDRQLNRQLLDFVDDIRHLAKSLDVEKMSIIGISGGGPYAAACAYKLPLIAPGLLKSVALVSADGPWLAPDFPLKPQNHVGFLIKNCPNLLEFMFKILRYAAFNWSSYSDGMIQGLPATDIDAQYMKTNGLSSKELAISSQESLRPGICGLTDDIRIQTLQEWGFHMSEIRINAPHRVFIWHGKNDKLVPVGVADYAAKSILNAESHIEENYGHFIFVPKFRVILQELIS